MLRMTETIVSQLKKRFPTLTFVYLFGSMATKRATATSDVDIAILATSHLDSVEKWDSAQELAILLKQDVDLIDLATASTVLRYEIITSGTLIYTQNPTAALKQEVEWMSEYLDFNETRRELMAEIQRRGTIYE